jgi:hypothetical protein
MAWRAIGRPIGAPVPVDAMPSRSCRRRAVAEQSSPAHHLTPEYAAWCGYGHGLTELSFPRSVPCMPDGSNKAIN